MSVAAAFAANNLTANSRVRRIPYIKGFFGRRLNAANITFVHDIVTLCNNRPRAWIARRFARLTQNARQNQCVDSRDPDNEVRVQQFKQTHRDYARRAAEGKEIKATIKYHVREINVNAFNALCDVLRYARNNPAQFPMVAGGIHIAAVPGRPPTRSLAAVYCGCQRTQASCNAFAVCIWGTDRAGNGTCGPRSRRAVGYEGIPPYEGQIKKARSRKADAPGRQRIGRVVKAKKSSRVPLP